MKNSKTGFENSLVLFGCSTNPVACIAPQKLDIKKSKFLGCFLMKLTLYRPQKVRLKI